MAEDGLVFLTWKGHVLCQWAGDPAGFGMQVEHGGFEAVKAQNNLQITHKGTALQGVSGICVAQTVRGEPIQLTTLCCRFDRPLGHWLRGSASAPA